MILSLRSQKAITIERQHRSGDFLDFRGDDCVIKFTDKEHRGGCVVQTLDGLNAEEHWEVLLDAFQGAHNALHVAILQRKSCRIYDPHQRGQDRSIAFLATYLVRKYDMTVNEALRYLAVEPEDCKFTERMRRWEQEGGVARMGELKKP